MINIRVEAVIADTICLLTVCDLVGRSSVTSGILQRRAAIKATRSGSDRGRGGGFSWRLR
jgi:hypothetical protein